MKATSAVNPVVPQAQEWFWNAAAAETEAGKPNLRALVYPNGLTRWSFYLSAFSIPFARIYIPGTGDKLGVIRIVQLLLILAACTQGRLCLRRLPVALIWFGGYCVLRIASGFWFSPGQWLDWGPKTLDWLQFYLPWVWVMFNLLQFRGIRRNGLWAYAWGCALCAGFHVLGIGVSAVDNSLEELRTTVFGENANVVGATYAVALIILIWLSMSNRLKLRSRLVVFPLMGLIGLAMAETGSRTAFVLVGIGVLVLLCQAESFASRARRYSAVSVMALGLAVIVWQVPTVMERFRDLDPQNIGHLNPRARMAPVLWEIFLRSPVYGSGPAQYVMELTRRAMPYLLREGKTIEAHNFALLLLVETGVIGFLVFATGLGKTLTAAWRARFQADGMLALALILPFVVSALVLSDPTSDRAFWLSVAYALAGAA